MDSSADWHNPLQFDSRQRIVNKIMETLKRHLPFSGQDGLQELRRISVKFEEKIYTAATSQADYLHKISSKMLAMETKSQNTIASNLTANPVGNSRNPADSGQAKVKDWRDEAYRKIKATKDKYLPQIREIKQKIVNKLQQHDAHPRRENMQYMQRLRSVVITLNQIILFLQVQKADITINHSALLVRYQMQILRVLDIYNAERLIPYVPYAGFCSKHRSSVLQR